MQSNCEHAKRRRAMRTAALLIAVSALTPPLAAQGTTAPGRTASTPPAPSAEAVARREAQAMLASALTRIAASPNDWRALYDAGRSALVLNDAGSATGFLGRAEQLAPTNGDIKAALGAAMVQMENPRGAIDMFTAARANGASERLFLSDQALAHDLLGEQPAAQRLYERALVAAPSPETERRYALSLGISGQVDRAVAVLSAQLRAQDRAAWRVRSFVLSFNGRHKEANDILYATTPKDVANSISGFLGKMDRLTPAQQALAAHFGRFPQGSLPPPRVAVAAAPPPAAATRAPLGETTIERRARLRDERRQGRAAANSRSRPVTVAMATPTPATPAPARSVTPPRVTPTPAPSPVAPSVAVASSGAVPSPGFASSAPAAGSLPVPRDAVTTAPTAPLTMPPATTRPAVPSAVAGELAQPVIPAPVAPVPVPAPVAVASSSPSAATPAPDAIAATDIPASSVPATPLGAVQGPPADNTTASTAVVQSPTTAMPVMTPVNSPAPASAGPASVALPTQVATSIPTPSAATPDVAAPTGFSLADIARSIEIPTEEAARPTGALDAAALEAVRVERLRVAEAAAARREKAAAAAKAKADAEAKVKADAEAKAKAEAKAEADRKKANPARLFVQIAAGANASALAGDYRRIAAKNAAGFKGQTGWTAEWGRTRRLLVGPFKDQKTAQAWLAAHKKAGGDGFPWSSEAGETVTRIGGK